eukprot:6481706-Amphidinium_carterae.1
MPPPPVPGGKAATPAKQSTSKPSVATPATQRAVQKPSGEGPATVPKQPRQQGTTSKAAGPPLPKAAGPPQPKIPTPPVANAPAQQKPAAAAQQRAAESSAPASSSNAKQQQQTKRPNAAVVKAANAQQAKAKAKAKTAAPAAANPAASNPGSIVAAAYPQPQPQPAVPKGEGPGPLVGRVYRLVYHGSFSPPHQGHLEVARSAQRLLQSGGAIAFLHMGLTTEEYVERKTPGSRLADVDLRVKLDPPCSSARRKAPNGSPRLLPHLPGHVQPGGSAAPHLHSGFLVWIRHLQTSG